MQNIHQLIHTVPLIEPTSSEVGILPTLESNSKGGALYFGTGLTTSKAMSVGVPFDVLGMLITAKKIQGVLGLSHVIQLIADTHALSNSFTTPEGVAAMADKMADVSGRVARLIGLEGVYMPLQSSHFDQSPEYTEIFEGVQSEDHEYVRREWSDIEYLRRTYNLVLKLSWIVDPKAKKVGFDERLYDLRFREVMGQEMSFIYLNPGRTLDPSRLKASPYISIAGERRILLDPAEDVHTKFLEAESVFGSDKLKSTRLHLSQIVSLYEEAVGIVAGESLEDKMQSIINAVFA